MTQVAAGARRDARAWARALCTPTVAAAVMRRRALPASAMPGLEIAVKHQHKNGADVARGADAMGSHPAWDPV